MFVFGDPAGRKPGEGGLAGESVQGTGQGPGGEAVAENGSVMGAVAPGSGRLGPDGTSGQAGVSPSMMGGDEGARLGVGGAFGAAGARVYGGLAIPQAVLQDRPNPFDVPGRPSSIGGAIIGGVGSGGLGGTGGIQLGAMADGGVHQWAGIGGGVQDHQLQQQVLMFQRIQAQQHHLQQQQQQQQQSASQQQQQSASQQQQLMAAAFSGGAVQSASAAHGQMNFMLPAQMRVQMAARMAQLGSAASDAAGVGATTSKGSGSSGGAGRGTCGIESLAGRAPGGVIGAAIPDAWNFAMTKAPPRQQQSLSVQDPHLQNQPIQQSTQVQQQLQPTPASQGDVIGVDQKWMATNVVPSSSPTSAYSMSSSETDDKKLLRTGTVGPVSSNTSSASVDVSGGAGFSGDSSLDSSRRGRGAGSNNGSSESSSTSRVGVLLSAKMSGDTTGGGIGGSNICEGSGGGSEGVVAFSPSGFQGRFPPQAPSSIDRGRVGSGSRVADSGASTAENALGMAAAVASFYNELPGSTDGRVDASKTGPGKMPTAGPGTTGSGWGGGGENSGELGVRVGGGGVQTTRRREGMDWHQPALPSQVPAAVSPGLPLFGMMDTTTPQQPKQPHQALGGFGQQGIRGSASSNVSGWIGGGTPIDSGGLASVVGGGGTAAVGTVGMVAGLGGSGGSGGTVGAMQPGAAPGTPGAIATELGKQREAYLQAVFQARMQQHLQQQQQQQQQQFACTTQPNQMMQAQQLATQVQHQFRLQAQQMHALFQTKQMALQQKMQAGQMTLQRAQQISQMQQAQLFQAIQTLQGHAQAQHQQALQLFAQQQVQQLQMQNIQQMHIIQFQQRQQQQQQQQQHAQALQVPAMGVPQGALQPLMTNQPEGQVSHRTPAAVITAPTTSTAGDDAVTACVPHPSSPGTSTSVSSGGNTEGGQSRISAVVPETAASPAGAAGPLVVGVGGGGADADNFGDASGETGVNRATLQSSKVFAPPGTSNAGRDNSSAEKPAPPLPPPPPPSVPQRSQQTTLAQNFEASAAASRVAAAAATATLTAADATPGGTRSAKTGVQGAGGSGVGGGAVGVSGSGSHVGAAVKALQQPIIKQQQQLMRQDEAAGSVAVLLPETQQLQQQQQKLTIMPTFTGSFVHAGVNPAPPSAVPPSGGLPDRQTIASGQSRWPVGAAGLGAGMAAVPPTPGMAVGATTPMPFQQHHPLGFVAAATGPTPVFPALGIAGAGGVGMLGAVMGRRLGLIGSNNLGNNRGGFQQQQQQPATIVASSIRGTNRAAGADFDLQQRQQHPPSVLPQNAHQPLQQQGAVGFSGRPGQTVAGSASPTFASAFSPAPAFALAPKPTGAPGADSGLMSDGAKTVAAAPGAGTTAAAAVAAASGPSPRPWNGGVVDEDDWGPEGEEEFMNMLNLAMDDEDVEVGQTKGAVPSTLDFLGWEEEDDTQLDEGGAQDDDDDDNDLATYNREGTKIALGPGSRLRRKQLIEKLEKAKVEMAADHKARTKEDHLALNLRDQWHHKMRNIALAILRRWWCVGAKEEICRANINGGCGDSGVEASWPDLLTEEAVTVAPVESGSIEEVSVGSQAGTVIASVRARAKETRLEGLEAVRAEAENMHVMREALGYPTPLGNLKLKFEVHVDHWAFGERELMCQWRVSTRNAALCGGRWELETRGMMLLHLWTSEDGEAPSVEPKSKPSTWTILRSPVDCAEPPSLPCHLQPPKPQSQSQKDAVMSAASPSPPRLLSLRWANTPEMATGRCRATMAATVPAGTVTSPKSEICSGSQRIIGCSSSGGGGGDDEGGNNRTSGVKRSRKDMEVDTVKAKALGGGGCHPPSAAGAGGGESKCACDADSRGGGGSGIGLVAGIGNDSRNMEPKGEGVGHDGEAGLAVKDDERPQRPKNASGGEGSLGLVGAVTGTTSGDYRAADKDGDSDRVLDGVANVGMEEGSRIDISLEAGSQPSNHHGGSVSVSRRFQGGDHANPGSGRRGSDVYGDGDGGGSFHFSRWRSKWPKLERNQGPPLGKVVGVPRQAKAREVYILYDHCGFVRELEESFGREIAPMPRTLKQAELPRAGRRRRRSGHHRSPPRPPPSPRFKQEVNCGCAGDDGGGSGADDSGRGGRPTAAPNGSGASQTEGGGRGWEEGIEKEEQGEEVLPCALTSIGSDGLFRVMRVNRALRRVLLTARRRRHSVDGKVRAGAGLGDEVATPEAEGISAWRREGVEEMEKDRNGNGSELDALMQRGGELGRIVRLKQAGRRKGARAVEFQVASGVVNGRKGEVHPAAETVPAGASSAGARKGKQRGGLLRSSLACRKDDEAQRELFREISEASRRGLPSWLPVRLVAADGSETQAYAAVYPLISLPSTSPAGRAADAMLPPGIEGEREGGADKDASLRHTLWEFHCSEGSVHLCVAGVVDNLMAALSRRIGEIMLEPAFQDNHSLAQMQQLVDSAQHTRSLAEGKGAAVGEGCSDRRRALSKLTQLWSLYQVSSQKELQLTSSFSLFHKGIASSLESSRRDCFRSRSKSTGKGRGGRAYDGNAKARFPGRVVASKGVPRLSRDTEEETVNFFMYTIRQFLGETRRGVLIDLLFHMLKGCEDDPELGQVIEEVIWSSWTVHSDEEVVRLMAEATKLSDSGKFDRSNAVLEKVLKIDENHAEVYNRRATNLMLKGCMQEAAADIQKVLAIEPRHFGALRGLGLLRMKLKDYSGALEAFDLAGKINPMMLPGLRDNVAVCDAAGSVMLS